MDDLVTWLRSCLDEVERVALQADGDAEVKFIASDAKENGCPDAGAHIIKHLPSRVLAEVEAKRRILDRYAVALSVASPGSVVSFVRGQDDGYGEACLDAIRDLALPYADRDGYRVEWAP